MSRRECTALLVSTCAMCLVPMILPSTKGAVPAAWQTILLDWDEFPEDYWDGACIRPSLEMICVDSAGLFLRCWHSDARPPGGAIMYWKFMSTEAFDMGSAAWNPCATETRAFEHVGVKQFQVKWTLGHLYREPAVDSNKSEHGI